MKIRLCLLVVALLSSSVSFAEVTNRVVARVNDRILTLYDFENRYQQALARIGDQMPADAAEIDEFRSEVAREVMRTLWDEMLILSRADQKGWSIPESDIIATIERMKAQNGIERDEDLEMALNQEGLTIESWKAELGNQLLYRQVVGREVYSRIDLPDEDLRRYYRSHPEEFEVPAQMQLREIVVLEGESASVLEERAAGVLEQLRGGSSFEEATADLPSGQVSSVIDLGWVEIEDLDTKLSVPLSAAAVGEYTDPIEARGGLHIAQLVDRRDAQIAPFDEVEAALRGKLEGERVEENLVEYLIELEKEAYLTLDPPSVAAGFRTSTGETPIEVSFPMLEDIQEQGLPDNEKASELEADGVETPSEEPETP